MPALSVRITRSSRALQAGLDRIRAEFHVPAGFPPDVERAASSAAERAHATERVDARDLELVTVDPKGSRDLDQAFGAVARDGGYRVHYAIADVAAFVDPGDPVDHEARARGVTLYLPDRRASLHPEVLCEGAASLLPGEARPALLWTIDLNGDGTPTTWRLARAVVRSREATTYRDVLRRLDAGGAPDSFELLRTIGELRLAQEQNRGGVSLAVPTQEVAPARGGAVRLSYDATLDSERWNAQISLLTGMCAARTMIDAGIGILRTLPRPDAEAVGRLRRAASTLGVRWPDGASYASVIRGLHAGEAPQAALLVQAVMTLRGAGYAVLDAATSKDPPEHGAIAAPYAHVTAPLRRLGDRFANEIVLASASDRAPEAWATDALADLPRLMAAAHQRAAGIDRAVVDLVEALVLEPHVGERFTATVVDRDDRGVTVMLRSPPVMARVAGRTDALGAELELRLAAVQPVERRVRFDVMVG
jgi:VacB/RNase II family 3'-5' exoribonuclease